MFKTYIITDDIDPKKVENVLENYSQIRFIPSPTEEDIIKNCRDADALISLYEPITSKVFDNLPNLKIVSLLSIGFNTVDVDYAKQMGVRVSNNPNYCLEEVADHTTAFILTLNRRLFEYNKAVKQEKIWKYDNLSGKIHRLSSQTLGLAGFGSIAQKVAKRMKAFGCNVLAYDPFIPKEIGETHGVQIVTLDELLENGDIISAHMPLNDSTRNFFSKETFSKMKKSPIFINCARGGIVDENALLEALDRGLISAAGLDVLSSEEPDLENCEFIERDNVILTPHAAFYSEESNEEAQIFTAKHVEYFIKGQLDKIPLIV